MQASGECRTATSLPLRSALDLGFFISISGIVTFKNAENVREVARQVPADRLLIETDSPFLAPVPSGVNNEPAFVAHTAAFLAELRQLDVEVLCEQTGENFIRLFGAVGHYPLHVRLKKSRSYRTGMKRGFLAWVLGAGVGH